MEIKRINTGLFHKDHNIVHFFHGVHNEIVGEKSDCSKSCLSVALLKSLVSCKSVQCYLPGLKRNFLEYPW